MVLTGRFWHKSVEIVICFIGDAGLNWVFVIAEATGNEDKRGENMKKIVIIFASLSVWGAAPMASAGELKGSFLTSPMRSEACDSFIGFATQGQIDPRYVNGDRESLEPFHTDSLVVIKNGQVVLEWYDGVKGPGSSHVLWSASKMITATLIGRTIQDGFSYQGHPVTLETKLSLFYPNPGFLEKYPERRAQYERITLGHLVEMSAGFDWREFYDDDMSNSSFLPMLYMKGQRDMPGFALSQKLSVQGPGEQWNYSGGNANILMGVLGKIHGASGGIEGRSEFPKKLLFDELGLEGARVEQDGSGNFVGSSYVYMTTRDMAKVGQLYLQGGVWNGKRLLPEGWTDEAQELVPTVFKKATTVDYITKLGAPSRRIFWLNRDIHREDGKLRDEQGQKVLYPREMPEAPSDLYFAAGHYGQLIAIVPSQNLIIARTGYDTKYWDHIQPLTVKALSCLVDGYKPNPVKTLVPPSAGPKKSTLRSMFDFVRSIPDLLTTLNYSKVTGLAASSIAKEMCSFSYVSGADAVIPERKRKEAYFERSGMPSFALSMMTGDLEFDVDDAEKRITVRQYNKVSVARGSMTVKKLVREVRAELSSDPRAGCRLL